MIYVRMGGRLGNLMFRYALARKVQLQRNNEPLCFIYPKKEFTGKDGFKDSLKYFQVTKYESRFTYRNIEFIKDATVLQKMLIFYWKLIRKFGLHHNIFIQKLLNRFGVSYSLNDYVPINLSNNASNVFLNNYAMSKKYFLDIRNILLYEFTPKNPELPQNYDLYEKIRNTNSVSISIRRGDYLLPKNKNHNVCTLYYYNKSIKLIKEKLPNCHFFIFSDDIEWCKQNLHFEDTFSFESGTDPVWEKLRLMYSCKHFILSNSTFAWWGQYLSRNENKIVISPSRWFANNIKIDLIEPNWILVEPGNDSLI
ncbi:alpha-1,2-fucosyltransferase [Fibrobacterales bacterium]|nr:alpha-1,2-fucosyltransferase [Fibrobacterales bacterium]